MSRHVKRQYAYGVLSVHAPAGDVASVRCVRVAGLLTEEVSEFRPLGGTEREGHPAEPGVSQPVPQAAIGEGSEDA